MGWRAEDWAGGKLLQEEGGLLEPPSQDPPFPGWDSLVRPFPGHPVAWGRSGTKKIKNMEMAIWEWGVKKLSFATLSMKFLFNFFLPRNGQIPGP